MIKKKENKKKIGDRLMQRQILSRKNLRHHQQKGKMVRCSSTTSLFPEEYEKRFEENLDDVTGSTPWDAYCVPPEPDPLYYESYEGMVYVLYVYHSTVYEAAMMHWMDVCLQHLSSNLPPEASQFQELLGLTAVQVEAVDEETKAQSGVCHIVAFVSH